MYIKLSAMRPAGLCLFAIAHAESAQAGTTVSSQQQLHNETKAEYIILGMDAPDQAGGVLQLCSIIHL